MTTELADALPPAQTDWAYFLDVDGTLIEIASRPEAVDVPESLIALLGGIAQAVDGACALISGRSIAELDHLFAPLRLPASGLHGVEWRDGSGTIHHATGDWSSAEEADELDRALGVAREELVAFVKAHPPVTLEDKGSALALHYRAAPALARDVHAAGDAIVAAHPGLVAQRGKMVVELKPAGIDKGLAVHRFVRVRPFQGRRPVFIGDDLTDEFGFMAVNELDGVSICVGDRVPTCAQWRLPSVGDAHCWLATLNARTSTGTAHGVA